MRTFLKKTISILLAAILFAELPMGEYTPDTKAATTTEETASEDTAANDSYISELKLFKTNGGNRAAVEERAKKDGWTIASEGNAPLNLNEYTERDDILLGYKTTSNKDEAITDLRMLEMDHGYEWFDYQKVAESQMDKMDVLADDIEVASKEFEKNMKNGSKAAEYAKDYLNYLYFTKDEKGTGSKHNLGDYFSSGNVDKQNIKKMLVRMNGGSLTTLYSQLALAVSDTEKNWLERIPETESYQAENDEETDTKALDRSYYDLASELEPVLKDFAKGYRKSQNHKNGDGQVAVASVSGDDELSSENVQEVIDAGNTDKNAPDLMYETAYEVLNKYTIGEDEKAGDYFLDLGEKSYSGKSDFRVLYPLVEALTDGQYGIMKIVGFVQMALNLNRSDDFYSELDKMKSEINDKLSELKGGEKQLSIYEGVNTEFYERQVALTSDAYRESKAGTLYTELTRQGEFYDTMNMIMTYISLAGSVASVITGCITIGLTIAGSNLTVWAACAGAVGSGVFASIGGVIGCAAVIAGYAVLVALIVVGIVYLVKWIVDQFRDDDKEDYTTMPPEVYDMAQVKKNGEMKSAYIKYLPVTNDDGKPQDINADDGKRWNLLYYSKNKDLGTPLVAPESGCAFARTTNDPDTPAGMVSVKEFGEKSAANLNSYTRKKDVTPIYLHFYTKNSIEDNGGVEKEDKQNQGEDDQNQEKDQTSAGSIDKSCYLYGLMVSHEESESAAKAAIKRKKGYRVYDKNLSNGKGYTYIGYSTTKVESDAIRDIRVIPNGGSEMRFGSASYSLAGTLDDGTTIMYSKYKVTGDPIYGGILTETKLLSPESGYEPVNMFCGGNAYDLYMNDAHHDPLYLYFKSSKSYTSGEKYLAGIQYVSVRKGEKCKNVDEYISDMGLTDFGPEIVSFPIAANEDRHGYFSKGKFVMFIETGKFRYDDYKIRLCYTYTYNPHRAIYDVKYYTATPRIEKLQPMIASREGAYAVAENILYSDMACLYAGSNTGEDHELSLRGSTNPVAKVARNHSCINPPKSSTVREKQQVKIEDNISWTESQYRLQSLYLLGPVADKNPLKVEDVVVTYDGEGMSGMHSVKRFTDPYSKPVDISYANNDKHRAVYMYLKGAETEKPKYISSIQVVTYKRPENTDKHTFTEEEYKEYDKYADDDCLMRLASGSEGGIYNYNFAIPQQGAWYNDPKASNSAAAYIGVNRTDSESQAITGIIMLKADSKPAAKIKVDGAEYHRAGDSVYGYFFYYTKSPGANPGLPLTDLTFDNEPVSKNVTTVAGISSPDEGDKKAEYLYELSDMYMYIHMKADTSDGVISDMTVFKAKDKTALMTEMMKTGFNYVVNENLNDRAGGEPIYLAYKMCPADNLKQAGEDIESSGKSDKNESVEAQDEDWSDFDFDFSDIVLDDKMIRDIVCVVGGITPEEMITHNGVVYNLVSDISLNQGTSGRPIYLYATSSETLTIGSKQVKLAPLSRVVACTGNAVPAREDRSNKFGTWEELLDTTSQIVDVNDSVISKMDDFNHSRDCRLFLFSHRYDQGPKPGAEINRGEVKDTFTIGDLYLRD
ncbi:MAG: hypothetical protein K5639_01195 [Eubacterium sp.]|nr:hypothetical protein [Eubacterium sp.]